MSLLEQNLLVYRTDVLGDHICNNDFGHYHRLFENRAGTEAHDVAIKWF